MPRAIWEGHVVAEAEQVEEVEGNIYSPPEALNNELVRPSEHTTLCGWKGTAHYFDLVDGDQVAPERGLDLPRSQARSRQHQGLRRLLLPARADRDVAAPGGTRRTKSIAWHRRPVHNFAREPCPSAESRS